MGVIRRARDISDADFLNALAIARDLRPNYEGASRWDVASVLGGFDDLVTARSRDPLIADKSIVPGVNDRAVLAKARKLIKSGKITGCGCGCAGFFTAEGEEPAYHAWPTGA